MVGILLINLGTPEAPTPEAVRAYLKEFLWDPRVVEIPRLVWWPILNFLVLPRRSKASAARYEKIWTRDGSPLAIYTQKNAVLLRGYLGERLATPVVVDYAMRYGKPSISERIQALAGQGCERILLLPLYPQYAGSTTASALDAAAGALARLRPHPEARQVAEFHADPGYIEALAQSARDFWMKRGWPTVLVMSFHGVPRRTIERGEPYEKQCLETARLLAEALELAPAQYRVSFQSRFGAAKWLTPYTAQVLKELGRAGTECVDVICPGFICDCLETLEEIAIEGQALFLEAGGGDFRYIPCLNDSHEWLAALADLAERQMEGWVEPRPPTPRRGLTGIPGAHS